MRGFNVEEGQVTVFGLTSPQAPKTYLRHQGWSIDYAFSYSVALVPDLDAEFYLCGPTAFMAAVQTDLEQRGVSPDRIHSESFGPVG